jgi:hypothetical protein
VADLDAAIRARLADAEHEDWCDQHSISVRSPAGCECFLGRANRALRAALDAADEFRGDHILNAAGAVEAIEQAIARELGLSGGTQQAGTQ